MKGGINKYIVSLENGKNNCRWREKIVDANQRRKRKMGAPRSVLGLVGESPIWVKVSHQPNTKSHI